MIRRAFLLLGLFALGVTVLLGLIPVPADPRDFDPTAPASGSDSVTVHGLPRWFLVTDESVKHMPSAVSLAGNFFFDWSFWFVFLFGVLSAGMIAVVVIANIARLAARVVLQFRR